MNFRLCFDNFNPSRFFVFSMLLLFTVLFSLKLDKSLDWSYWAIFMPLWIWKFVVLVGFLIGTIAWCQNPLYQHEAHRQYKSMAISTVYQIVLLFFEVLVCAKLEDLKIDWIFVFIPLLLLSIFGIGVCFWSMKHEQNFELEFFLSVNILLFIFIALKLDNLLNWSWGVVFIPLWIVTCISIIFQFYGLILAFVLCRTPELLPDYRRNAIFVTTSYIFVVFPMFIFEVLLTRKLDLSIDVNYVTVFCPLLVTLLVMIMLSFLTRTTNHLWFGFQRPICQLILGICKPLQLYGNISYKLKSAWSMEKDSIDNFEALYNISMAPTFLRNNKNDSGDFFQVKASPKKLQTDVELTEDLKKNDEETQIRQSIEVDFLVESLQGVDLASITISSPMGDEKTPLKYDSNCDVIYEYPANPHTLSMYQPD